MRNAGTAKARLKGAKDGCVPNWKRKSQYEPAVGPNDARSRATLRHSISAKPMVVGDRYGLENRPR